MKMRSVAPMRFAKIGYIVLSCFFCAAGIVLLALPELNLPVMGRTLGAALAAFGVVKLVGFFSKDLFRLAFQYDLEFGILLLALGIVVLCRPGIALEFICISLGVAILADGLFRIRISLEAHRFGIRPWWMLLALAVAAGGVGLTLVLRPWESARLLAVLLGVALLAEGALNLSVAVSTVKIVKNQLPDRIDRESPAAGRRTV